MLYIEIAIMAFSCLHQTCFEFFTSFINTKPFIVWDGCAYKNCLKVQFNLVDSTAEAGAWAWGDGVRRLLHFGSNIGHELTMMGVGHSKLNCGCQYSSSSWFGPEPILGVATRKIHDLFTVWLADYLYSRCL